ncbi:MAG: integrin alpha, partial [Actinobacteria bacterium]|nr:integrin alpha [Actinomycetota bacterium]
MAGVAASPVLAAGNGLPRSYNAQRIDSPQPEDLGLFSLALQLAGDLDRDGRQDLISPQVAGFNTQGRVYVYSGATGALIDTITAPDLGGAGGNAQFGLLGTGKVGLRPTAAPFSDLGSCPGGRSGQTCPANPIGPPDGVPELLIGATGVDVGGVVDVGRVYVIDGATRAVLKRIDMPAADRVLTGRGAGFGREVLAPEGLPACEGNAGIGLCEKTMPTTVQIGDMDAGGRPEIVVGARRFNETPATAQPGSHCASAAAGASCRGAGRAYIYRGEDIAGTNPTVILDGSVP